MPFEMFIIPGIIAFLIGISNGIKINSTAAKTDKR